MKKNKKILALGLTLSLTLFLITPVLAADTCTSTSLVNTCAAGYKDGNYKLEDVREYAIYIAKLILGLVGSASLLAFVIGGVMFLISAGDQGKVKQGKEIIKAAVIGIIITFSSVLIISLFLQGFGLKLERGTGKIIGTTTQQ